jgi:predicted DNA-binding WGR domain protein
MTIRLLNTTTRNAFYEIRRVKTSVVTRWGRIGTDGRINVDYFMDVRSAQAFVDDKLVKKTEIGDYRRVA